MGRNYFAASGEGEIGGGLVEKACPAVLYLGPFPV